MDKKVDYVNDLLRHAEELQRSVEAMEDRDKFGLLSEFVLLKEELRLVILAILEIKEIRVDYDTTLSELFMEVSEISVKERWSILKFEGFADLELSMKDVEGLVDDDVQYFKAGVFRILCVAKTLLEAECSDI